MTKHGALIAAVFATQMACAVDVTAPDEDDGSQTPPSGQANWAPWPMLGQGPMHRSRSLSKKSGADHRSWDLVLGQPVRGSCVIGANGTIYAATESGLHAVSADGVAMWTAPIALPEEEPPSPAIGPGGRLYVRNGDALAAFDATGVRLWEVTLAGIALSSPTVTADGTVHVAAVGGGLILLHPDGSVIRALVPGDDARYSAPVIDDDGRMTFMQVDSFASTAWSFDDDGTVIVDAHPLGAIYGYQAYPVSGLDGVTYFSVDGGLLAMAASGDELWEVSRGSNNVGPAVGADGTVYWASGGPLVAYEPTGAVKWSFPPEGPAGSSVAIAGDGTIYLAGEQLFEIDESGAIVAQTDLGSPISSQLAIDDDGTVIVGTSDGVLHAR